MDDGTGDMELFNDGDGGNEGDQVRRTDVLNDYETCRYIRLENGFYADVYSLENHHPRGFPDEHLSGAPVPPLAGGQGYEGKGSFLYGVRARQERRLLKTFGKQHQMQENRKDNHHKTVVLSVSRTAITACGSSPPVVHTQSRSG